MSRLILAEKATERSLGYQTAIAHPSTAWTVVATEEFGDCEKQISASLELRAVEIHEI